MEQEPRHRPDLMEFARSVEQLRATWAETSRLTNEVLRLTTAGFREIHLANARILGRAGRRRLRMTAP